MNIHLRDLGSVIRSAWKMAVLALLFQLYATPVYAITFTERTGWDNPFDGVDIGTQSRPTFVDIDDDGDFDAFIGEGYGYIKYYKNTGSAASPTFTLRTGADNPFDGVDVGDDSSPAFVDIDNDGDFDAFIGESVGNINYYENTTSVSVTFTNGANAALNYQQTSPSPPQNNWHFGQFSLAGDATGAALNSVVVTLGGTYDSGDLGSNPFRLYASNTNDFGTASAIGSDVADPGSGNDVTFSSLSDGIPSGTRYYWVTADISGTATGDDNINGTIDVSGDLSISGGTLSGSSNYGKLNAGSDVSLPVELTSFTVTAGDGQITLRWTTESEIENLGFNIYRSTNSNVKFLIINDELIPGAGSSSSRHEYEYVDKGLTNGVKYRYKLEDVDYSGNTKLHGPVSATPIKKAAPKEFRLYPNYPNPFNPFTTISYDLPDDGFVELSVYNMRGEKVATLMQGNQEAGSYRMNWDGTSQSGDMVASGIYFLRIASGSYSRTSKIVFIR
ncbi:MAG: T9SS type A sorting domain-containing protein [Candidatus Marinimicrobia bacterium]|nr:T9SS type A sorting domain-containing protein [Candidatus Neomarinimicrobiota bacterium]